MAYTVTVTVNHAEVLALLTTRARLIGQRVQRVAIRRAPKHTGAMAASVSVSTGATPGYVHADIGTHLPQGIWTHEGTGEFAGRGPIKARRAAALRFVPRNFGPVRGSGKFRRGRNAPNVVFAHSVRGQPPNPWLASALQDVVGGSGRIRRFGNRGRRGS